MRFSNFPSFLALLGLTSLTHLVQATSSIDALRGGGRQLEIGTTCLGSSLQVNGIIGPNESICSYVEGEDVYFGIWTYDMDEPGYTMYRVEVRSVQGTFDRLYSGIGTKGDPVFMKLQGDGNLVFGGQSFSSCIVLPGRQTGGLLIGEEAGELALSVADSKGQKVWKLGAGECYPSVEDSCVSSLAKDERLSWKEYICTYDEDGTMEYKFGLNEDVGLLGLWKGNTLIWRPSGGSWLRGDYLHFQDDGHLTLYKDTSPKTYVWTSDDCVDYTATKLVLTSDGDVQELNHQGAIVWTLQGSKHGPDAATDPRDSVPEVCMPLVTCVVPPTTPLFVLDDHVDIGDTLERPGPGFAEPCGSRCYDVKDNGDDPPPDSELGDTLHFAYQEITSRQFLFRAKVCGTHCDDREYDWNDFLGRVGLNVRQSLDPLSNNLFVSHHPQHQADWSYRTNHNSVFGFHGSPDVECLWITIERHSLEDFTFAYNYPLWRSDDAECDMEESMLNTSVTIPDMHETVLVGLAVSTGVSPPYCRFTTARFSEIQLDIYD